MVRGWRRRLLVTAGVVTLAAVGTGFYLRSQAFQRQAEGVILARIGATAQSFRLTLWPLEVSMSGVRMPGVEVERVEASVSWRSLLGGHVRLRTLTVDRPLVHVEHGGEKLAAGLVGGGGGINLAVERLEVRNGRVNIADRSLPWAVQLSAVEVRAAHTAGGYAGTVAFASDEPVEAETSVRFDLIGDDVRLDEVTVRTAGATVSATGWVRTMQRPRVALSTHLTGEARGLARTWARYIRWRELPEAGTVWADGKVTWSAGQWSVNAEVEGNGLRIRGVGPWTVTGHMEGTPTGLTLHDFDLRGMGAHIAFSGASTNWRGLMLDAHIEGLSLAAARRFVAAVPTGLDGVVSGQATVDLRGARKGIGVAAKLSVAPAQGAGLPFSGTVTFSIRGSQTAIQQASLQLGSTAVEASGRWKASGVDLAIQLRSPEIGELRGVLMPVVARMAPGVAVPAFGGAVDLAAQVTGQPSAPTVTGKLAVRHGHWGGEMTDALTIAGTASREAANVTAFTFQSGGQRITGRGVVGLDDYRVTAASSLDGSVQVDGLRLTRVRGWTGLDADVRGVLSARATVHGTVGRPEATGTLSVAQIEWRGQAARSVTAGFALRQGKLSSTNLSLRLGRTQVRGSFSLDLDGHTFRTKLSSGGVDLREIAWLQSKRLAVGGSVRFELSAQGNWADPEADLVFTTTGLSGGSESLGDAGGRVHLAHGTLAVQAADVLANGSFHLHGTVAATAPYAASATLELRDYDFDAWLRRFTSAEVTGHSRVSGTATVQGPLAEPTRLTAQVRLDPVSLSVSGLAIHNQGPVQITADQRGIVLAAAHLVALDTDVTLEGTARPPARRAPGVPVMSLGGHLEGTINLALIHSLYAPLRTSGTVQMQATVGGTTAAPQVRGQVRIVNARVAEENSPVGFDGVDGLLRLEGRRLQVERLTAHTSGGTLSLTGYVTKLDKGASFDLHADGQNLRLRYQGISATGNAQLRLSGQRDNALLSGEAQLNRVGLDRNFDLAVFIASTQARTGPPNPDSLLSKIRLNVHLVTGPRVEVATNLAHLQLQADLRMRGTLAEPSVLGRASASEGRLLFAGNQYQVTKAQVQFVNPFRIEPLLDVGLRTTVQQYDVTLNLSGAVDKLAITYRSDPPLSSSDVVALLATGQPTQATASLSAAGNYAPSEALLGEALNNLVAGRLQRLFGITQVKVNPNGGALGTTGSGGTVTIQQQLARNLKLTYTQNLANSSQDIVQVDWTISRLLGLTISRDQFGLYGLKFTFRHRKR